jgi:cytochrome P450
MDSSADTQSSYLDVCGQNFDPLNPMLTADLTRTLREMRERCPALRSEAHGGFVAVTRYDDITRIFRDWETFSSARGMLPVPPPNPEFRLIPPETDPPLHREYRNLLNPFFTAAAVARLEDRLREIVIETLDQFTASGKCEFVSQFANVIPGRVIYDAFYEAPAEDLPRVLHWIHAISKDPMESVVATREYMDWARKLLAERSASPRGEHDIIAHIGKGQLTTHELSDEERAQLLSTLIFASLDTGEVALSTAAFHLAANPGIAAKLRAAPRRAVLKAVEEFLRFDPPAVAMARTTTREVEIAGEQIAAGEKVTVYLAAANRDPAMFDDPDSINIERDANPHLSFGWGPHRCVGRPLALLELAVSLEQVLRRMPDLRIEPGAEVTYRQGLNRYPETVPLVFTPTAPERA